MESVEKAKWAVLAVFPSVESLGRFAAEVDNRPILDSFLAFAFQSGIVAVRDQQSLADFVRDHAAGVSSSADVPNYLGFEELLERKDELLKLTLSLRALTDRINLLLAAQRVDLPRVSNSMLTRLKKEPADTLYKQNVLRSLAFWLGHERGELGSAWNYETLFRLCRESRPAENFREGVRIGFALYSRGDFIDHDLVSWLKKALKQYVELKLDHYLYGRWGKVRAHDMTTLYIDLPKEEESVDPAAYRDCLRSAVFLAHHIAVRWSLSEYCTKKRFLSVGIVAGEYGSLDNYLLPILSAKLPGDPLIRVSDFSRQCLLINDIRVILCQRPTEVSLFSGEALSIWAIVSLWNFIYFEFIPDLLADKNLGSSPESVAALNRLLWFPEEMSVAEYEERNAVQTFLRAPQNALLGIEIAKTLFFRRRFSQAMEILRIVLSVEPDDLVARTLLMVVYRSMALEAGSLPLAINLFRMAEQEGLQIISLGIDRSEDFYCEYGIVFLARGLTVLKFLRAGTASSPDGIEKLTAAVSVALERAEELLERGVTISPSGIRSAYLLASVRIVQACLQADRSIFTSADRRLDGRPELIREQTGNLLRQRGYQFADQPTREQLAYHEKLMAKKAKIHNDSISLQAYRPTIFFTNSVGLWDYFPVRTVASARKVTALLREAIDTAINAASDDVCIYSFTRIYGEIMSVEEFIAHMEKSLAMVAELAGGELAGGELAGRPDEEEIVASGEQLLLLMTLNQ